MIEELFYKWIWIVGKIALTVFSVYTINNIILGLGYRSNFYALLTIAVISLITIRIWIPGKGDLDV
jgi:hypothetical protein